MFDLLLIGYSLQGINVYVLNQEMHIPFSNYIILPVYDYDR